MKNILICSVLALIVLGCSSKNSSKDSRWEMLHQTNAFTYYADKETFDSKNHFGWIKQVPSKDNQKINPDNKKEFQHILSKQIASCDIRAIKIDYMEAHYKDGSSEQIKLPFIRPRLEVVPGTPKEKIYNWLCSGKSSN